MGQNPRKALASIEYINHFLKKRGAQVTTIDLLQIAYDYNPWFSKGNLDKEARDRVWKNIEKTCKW